MHARLLAALAALTCACSFEGAPIDELPDRSDQVDASAVADPDGSSPVCVFSTFDLCDEDPRPPWNPNASEVVDTDTDPRCITVEQTGGPDTCAFYVEAAAIGGGISIRAEGTRPFLILSQGPVTVDGTLDVSSSRTGTDGAGANVATCAVATLPQADAGGAGGAAGGSFAGKGGDGGEGDTDDSLGGDGTGQPGTASDALGAINLVRGGCGGGIGGDESIGGGDGGVGGASGGALYLASGIAINISSTGRLNAGGAGALGGEVQAGGGGGGSGGLVIVEAVTVRNDGRICASGGGGGEGGNRQANGTPVTGDFGEDGCAVDGVAAPGGVSVNSGGDGGAGSNTDAAGITGSSSATGAGGGGGGGGFIELRGDVSGSGVRLPLAN